MTYEEMREIADAPIDEGKAAALKAEQVLACVPGDDIIVGELHGRFMLAADEFISQVWQMTP